MMAKARFGGAPTDVLFTPTAWGAFRKNNATLKLLDVNVRGTNANFDIGVGDGEPIQFKGRFNGTLNLWLYSDYYEDEAGMQVNYMTEGDILLLAPAQRIDGVRAYGAILDKAAQLRPQAIFPKMWDMEDPSGTIIMTQSAPLPIPVNPNGTTRVRVL